MKRISLAAAVVLTPLWLTVPVEAIEFNPPINQRNPPPGETDGGGTRSSLFQEGKPLTALVPETQFGLTVAKYPTFFVYVPSTSGQQGVFVLLDENEEIVYETILTLPGTNGVISVSLPTTDVDPLEVGKTYHWYFGIINDPDDRSKDRLVEGWVQRIEPNPTLVSQLGETAPQEHPALYAGSGVWHEALATLAELRRSNPDDAMLASQWEQLLQSESVELDKFANEPLWLTVPVEAIEFNPPINQRNPPPGEVDGGSGTRSSLFQQGKPLTALVPETQFGLTVAEYPTFFVYVPSTSGQQGVFVLLDENEEIVYETILTLPGTNGVISVSLPTTDVDPLEIDKTYHWYFGIINDPDDRSKDRLVEGWVQRIEPNPTLVSQLDETAPQEHPALYAAAGIWHEALATLAELRRSNPDDAMLASQWEQLLQSESVELDEFANEPLLESLSTVEQGTVQPLNIDGVREQPEAGETRDTDSQFSSPDLRTLPRGGGAGASNSPLGEPSGGGTR